MGSCCCRSKDKRSEYDPLVSEYHSDIIPEFGNDVRVWERPLRSENNDIFSTFALCWKRTAHRESEFYEEYPLII